MIGVGIIFVLNFVGLGLRQAVFDVAETEKVFDDCYIDFFPWHLINVLAKYPKIGYLSNHNFQG